MPQQQFVWSDAWLLAAIFWAHRAEQRATLDQVVAYGDAINHAIFTPAELESGLARLSEAGLIREEESAFVPSGTGEAWFAAFKPLRVDTIESLKWFSQKLGAQPYRTGNEHVLDARYPGFTRERYDEAVAAYQLRASQVLRSLGLTER